MRIKGNNPNCNLFLAYRDIKNIVIIIITIIVITIIVILNQSSVLIVMLLFCGLFSLCKRDSNTI